MLQVTRRISDAERKTNARLKDYPDFSVLQVANVAMFKRPEFDGYEKHSNEFWNFKRREKDEEEAKLAADFELPYTEDSPGVPMTKEENRRFIKEERIKRLLEEAALNPRPVVVVDNCSPYQLSLLGDNSTVPDPNADAAAMAGLRVDLIGLLRQVLHDRQRVMTCEGRKPAKDPERAKEESLRRARAAVRDIAYCNKFTMMFTLTFDGKRVDRYDPKAVYKSVRTWFTNMSQRHDLKYVAIPEYHKKKQGEESAAIHIHGLAIFGDESVLVRSTFKDGKDRVDSAGRPVYNISTWSYGWSTAVPLDDTYTKAVSYVTKYMGKQDDKIFGKWYLSSRQTSTFQKRPNIIALDDMDFNEFRDEAKIRSGDQFEQKVFRDVTIISEELWKTPDRMEGF